MTLVIIGKLLNAVFIHSDVERCLKDTPEGYSGHIFERALCFH